MLLTELVMFASILNAFVTLERCESGRIGLPAKELCPYGYRGFESPLLRTNYLFEAIAQLDRASDCGSEGRQFEPA